ncbi:hypothetical protein ADK67_44615 [Saccharothrix sp. NRRL B-16348]|uniref:DUF397 domain-containing protein n=1 Tax=Saccharothrix sp. NRRL B-16348 TaxID=1415542 RepID=UPI0006B001D7|nr:DUF397 domain-containing protein [Saccharothrix sp. NRRL B-16348]KOX13153.1 hypothetical protein ADK67_44615 [Saccharothrix sp. NRRL B-16348]
MTPDFSAAEFKTSSYTEDNGTCVEVAVEAGFGAVRDTKNREGGHVAVPARSFAAFLRSLAG